MLGSMLFGGTSWAAAWHPQWKQNGHPAPIVREAPPAPPRPLGPQGAQGNQFATRSGQNQEHLQQWMQSHGSLTLEQQQKALQNEPGFRQFTPETQQRMLQELGRLNQMSPQQRQRAFDRTEAMERLPQARRIQVRDALTSLGLLPKDRRMYVSREFRAMRDMPAAQQQAFLNSPVMRARFSDQERQILGHLFEVAPYLPPPQAAPGMSMPAQTPGTLPPR
jgi:hypothetical protein